MAQINAKTQRFDPYKTFKFRIRWEGRHVAGFARVSTLKPPAVVRHREGGDPSTTRKSPGRTKFEAITLERGVTHDADFQKWANSGSRLRADASLKDLQKDVILEAYNEAGQLTSAYRILRCWVSAFQALPDLDANANAIAIEHLKLENEGWKRDFEKPPS